MKKSIDEGSGLVLRMTVASSIPRLQHSSGSSVPSMNYAVPVDVYKMTAHTLLS